MLSLSPSNLNCGDDILIADILSSVSSNYTAAMGQFSPALPLRFEMLNVCLEPVVMPGRYGISGTTHCQSLSIDRCASVSTEATLFID